MRAANENNALKMNIIATVVPVGVDAFCTVVYNDMNLNNLITTLKNRPEYTLSNFYRIDSWQK